jgi:AraC family ethanolamine operon transcriptional activator
MERVRYDDFDACAAALRPWNLEALQLDRGPFRGELIQAQSPTTLAIAVAFERKLHQTGEPPKGLRTVGIPATGQEFRWRNRVACGDQLVVFPRGSELDVVSSPGFRIFSVSFSEDVASALACDQGRGEFEDLVAGREIVDCSSLRMQNLRLAAERLVTPSERAGPDVGVDLIEALVEALILDEPARPLPSHEVRELAVARSLDLIDEHHREALSAAALCRAARVSRRTLEYAFQERFGLPPKAYMIVRRLSGAREELKRGRAQSVTRTANSWGFHHLSQFSALYKRHFGELPSTTMRAANPSR